MSEKEPLKTVIGHAEWKLLQKNAEDQHFLERVRPIAPHNHCVFLLSGGQPGHDQANRYSLAAWNPYQILQTRGDNCKRLRDHELFVSRELPLDFLDRTLDDIEANFPREHFPFCGGALGYFSYDLKNSIEKLPTSVTDHLKLPDIYLMWPRQMLILDRLQGHLHEVRLYYGDDRAQKSLQETPMPLPCPHEVFHVGSLKSNFTRCQYLKAIEKARDYIRAGDIYQVNLSQQFQCDFAGSPFDLWISLFNRNPAPFYAFINAGDHQIVSTSMERFLSMKNGHVETRPIKGTRPRGKTRAEDRALAEELRKDPKEDAELSMIVDLLRNDLGKICAPRTIRVAEHKKLESYQNVHHLISIVEGHLKTGTTYGDILRATFPGGSITGCPKIRAMEIIDELETSVRHIYTGSMGYLGCHGNMDLNIAIRTALVHCGKLYFSVGGGIVYDSDPQAEYEETLHKGLTFFQTLKSFGTGNT